MQQPHEHRKIIIWIAVIALGLAAIGGIAYGVWQFTQQRSTPVKTQSFGTQAQTAKNAGIAAEANGKSEEALIQYQKALDFYRQAGDSAAAADMGYKVDFIKQAVAAEKKATEDTIRSGEAIPTPDNINLSE